ncbi:uncharacterized protein LOC101771030 [Setaria italica]|uniref:uncharacterized protein LOC101771030 n=1 Tax=Setaria italica TaxID=4555 RepID=UPI000BE5BB23|nr:uncharacterized protein LOC101771030 [Setaria italica]
MPLSMARWLPSFLALRPTTPTARRATAVARLQQGGEQPDLRRSGSAPRAPPRLASSSELQIRVSRSIWLFFCWLLFRLSYNNFTTAGYMSLSEYVEQSAPIGLVHVGYWTKPCTESFADQ